MIAVVAELSVVAAAPALDAAAVEDRAGVLAAGCDGDGAGVEVDGAQARHIACLIAPGGIAVVAKPPRSAVAPALDAAAVEDRAGVALAGRDGNGAGAEVDDAQARHIVRLVSLVVPAVVAEPPVGAAAPALDVAANEDHAGVTMAGRDGDGAGVEVDCGKISHVACFVALAVSAVVAELPVGAVAPALDAAAVEDCAGVVAAG